MHQGLPKLPDRLGIIGVGVPACGVLKAFDDEHQTDEMGGQFLVPFQFLISPNEAKGEAPQGHRKNGADEQQILNSHLVRFPSFSMLRYPRNDASNVAYASKRGPLGANLSFENLSA